MAFDIDKERSNAEGGVTLNMENIDATLRGMSLEGLLNLKARVNAVLPASKLSSMNLEEELVDQFRLAKILQSTVLTDPNVPANQKAQVSNTCASILSNLQDTQNKFYTAERLKSIEGLLIEHAKSWPTEEAKAFLDAYQEKLESANV